MSLDKRDAIQILTSVMRVAALGLLVCLLAPRVSLAGAVIPSTEWINVYSTRSTFDGQALPVGSSIAVFDPQGTQCGEFQVTLEGWYGLMACYRDDAMTPVDEGPVAGDALRFTINGVPAAATPVSLNGTGVAPSTQIVWTAQGDLWEVDLQGWAGQQPVGGYSLPVGPLVLLWPWGGLVVAAIGLVVVAMARHGRREDEKRDPES